MERTSVHRYVLNCIADEFNKLLLKQIKAFAEDHGIEEPSEDNLKRYCIQEVPMLGSSHQMRIVRSKQAPATVAPGRRCRARTWNNGHGGRCKRHATHEDNGLCTSHQKAFVAAGKLKHGFVDEVRPNVFPREKGVT